MRNQQRGGGNGRGKFNGGRGRGGGNGGGDRRNFGQGFKKDRYPNQHGKFKGKPKGSFKKKHKKTADDLDKEMESYWEKGGYKDHTGYKQKKEEELNRQLEEYHKKATEAAPEAQQS